ncbi:DUF2786 domain-containing protein [Actinomadura sp. NPDC047616]|uniref:DUF2786 domain-containing protein n=1 Tax=Actinomadura sp. NPDC047616 TaxID=3155914 RepID=UPI0033CFA207
MAGRNYKKMIKALLDKAEHPNTNPEEAAACAAKAAELMMRFGIDAAQLRKESGRKPEDIEMFTLELPGDHGTVLIEALYPIAQAMGAKCVVIDGDLVMVGTVSMLENLEILLASLQLQMIGSSNAAGDAHEAKLRKQHPDWDDELIADMTDRWVWDYIRGFGRGVAEKIAKKRQIIIDESPGNELVLQTEQDRIRAQFHKMFPHLRPMRQQGYSSAAAQREGFAAGKMADVGDGYVGGQATRALTR